MSMASPPTAASPRTCSANHSRFAKSTVSPAVRPAKLLEIFAKAKRQLQKLFYRGKFDLVSGKFFLKKHMREKTTFSSNIGVDKL